MTAHTVASDRLPATSSVIVPARRRILDAVSLASGIGVGDLLGSARPRAITDARRAAYVVMRRCGYSLTQIGRALRKDHTTVLHGLRQANLDVLRRRFEFCDLLDTVEAMLESRGRAAQVALDLSVNSTNDRERDDAPRGPGRPRCQDAVAPRHADLAVLDIPVAKLDRARLLRRTGGTLKGTAKALHVDPLHLAMALGEAIRCDMKRPRGDGRTLAAAD